LPVIEIQVLISINYQHTNIETKHVTDTGNTYSIRGIGVTYVNFLNIITQ